VRTHPQTKSWPCDTATISLQRTRKHYSSTILRYCQISFVAVSSFTPRTARPAPLPYRGRAARVPRRPIARSGGRTRPGQACHRRSVEARHARPATRVVLRCAPHPCNARWQSRCSVVKAMSFLPSWTQAFAFPFLPPVYHPRAWRTGRARMSSAQETHGGSVFDHSWSLLSGREREAFAALSAFRGGFAGDGEAGGGRVGARADGPDRLVAPPPRGRRMVRGARALEAVRGGETCRVAGCGAGGVRAARGVL